MNFLVDNSVRAMPEYAVGQRAYQEGRQESACPFRRGEKRVAWCTGWFDERMKNRLGTLLEKYGETWP